MNCRSYWPSYCTWVEKGKLGNVVHTIPVAQISLTTEQNNIPYVIVDQESVPRDRNWAITLGWALPLLQSLLPEEIYNTLQQCQPDPNLDPKIAGQVGILVRDGISGETKILSRFPVIRRLNHQKTKQHWSTGLDILRGKRLTDITIGQFENWVKAHFDDGTTETGTTIIGADGGASYVRRWLLGDLAIPEALPCEFMNFSFTLPADIALRVDKELNPTVDAGIHPTNMYLGIFLLDKPDLAKPESWVFYILTIWPLGETVGLSSSRSRLGELRLRTDKWFDLFKTVVENISDDTEVKPDQLRIWKTNLWNNYGGRVTLAGDAAHRYAF